MGGSVKRGVVARVVVAEREARARAVRRAITKEREACAKLAAEYFKYDECEEYRIAGRSIADEIHIRGRRSKKVTNPFYERIARDGLYRKGSKTNLHRPRTRDPGGGLPK